MMKTQLITRILERCAQTLEQVIAPNVTGTFASAQAVAIGQLLRTLAPVVEMKSQVFSDENEEMRKVLGTVLETLRGATGLSENGVRNGLIERLDQELSRVRVAPHDVSEENDELKGALVETIEGLDALTSDFPEKTMLSLRLQIRAVLRQQLDNEIAHASLPV